MSLADLLPTALQIGSTIMSAGGQIAKGNASELVARRKKAAADYEATQLDQSATESRGAGMRGAADQSLRAEVVTSEALARAAASGAGAGDPTVSALISRIVSEGAYRSGMALYEGNAQARLDNMRSDALRYSGDTGVADAGVAANASNTAALNTVLSGGSKALSLYERYWSGPRGRGAAGAGTFDGGGDIG